MDVSTTPDGPATIAIRKPAQIGVSEAVRNIIYYWVHNDPGPCLLVYPDVSTARSQFIERLLPLLEQSDVFVRSHKADGQFGVELATMSIYLTWASSAARLSARPIRYVIIDEADKMQFAKTAREQAPVELARARTRTYGKRGKLIILSTPSLRSAPISQEMDLCREVRRWSIECTGCKNKFYPTWDHVSWPKRPEDVEHLEWAEKIQNEELALLTCPSCKHVMTETERQIACNKGAWVYEPIPNTDRIGFQISILGTRWSSMHRLVSKWLKVHLDPGRLQEFINQELGEVFEQRSTVLSTARLKDHVSPEYKLGSVPAWVSELVCGIDSSLDGWWWVVMGYGAKKRSIVVDHGFAPSLDTLTGTVLNRFYPYHGAPGSLRVVAAAIDARGSPDILENVLRWALADPRVRPIMGVGRISDRGGDPIREVPWQREINHGSHVTWIGGKRYSIDVDYFKDLVVSHMSQGLWLMPGDIQDAFTIHFNAEAKVKAVVRGQVTWVWKKKAERMANHYWDCCVYCEALAYRFNYGNLPQIPVCFQTAHEMPPAREEEQWLNLPKIV